MVVKTGINVAGGIFSLIDEFIVINTGWSLYDEISATARVYKNTNDSQIFYVYINDANTGYTSFKLWQSWNSETHTGSGNTTDMRHLIKSSAQFCMVGDNLTFLIFDDTNDLSRSIYIGFIDPVDSSDKTAIVISGCISTSASAGTFLPTATTTKLLFGRTGSSNVNAQVGGTIYSKTSYSSRLEKLYLPKIPISDESDGNNLRGYARFAYGNDQNVYTGFSVGQTITIQGKTYKLIGYGTYTYKFFVLYE